VNLLIKLHDKSRDLRRNLKDWMGRVKKWDGGNTRVIDGFDITPYLFVSDILVSDFSSAANEFLLLDRPIIFLDTPEKYEINKERWDTEVWGQRVGTLVKTMAEFDKAMEDAITNPQRMSEIRRAAAQDIFYKPGTATVRAARKIYQILELDPPESLVGTRVEDTDQHR
jgi:CDP-glycerol glycerophosphotransferase (TagB/SpsB family)